MDWLPQAIHDPHARSFPWQEDVPAKGLLHTTEGGGWPDYQGWTIMPHATVMPLPGKGVIIRQHLPFSQASFSLVHATDLEPTNGAHAFQFELVGTSDPSGPSGAYYWPAADDAVLLALYQEVIKPLSDAFDIPLHTPTWEAYPASYGPSAVRLNTIQWHSFSGWLGHEHAPENVHGDPGLFPWARLIALANGEDMPTLDEIGALLDRKLGAFAAELLTTNLGRSGPNVGVALQSGYVASTHAAEGTDAILAKLDAPPAVTLADRLDSSSDDGDGAAA